MTKLTTYSIERARELQGAPEPGKPYSVPVPGSQQPGRSAVYRHWRFPDELVETLDPKVCLLLPIRASISNISDRSELLTTSSRKLRPLFLATNVLDGDHGMRRRRAGVHISGRTTQLLQLEERILVLVLSSYTRSSASLESMVLASGVKTDPNGKLLASLVDA
jgi:hypothetical protein